MDKVKIVKNSAKQDTYDLYVYGEITSEAWYDTDITTSDFKETLDDMSKGSTLNMYINSPGGSVFTTDAIISMLKRAKATKNIKIVAYIDGLGASCASFLPMIADEIIIYSNSILMVHKPWSFSCGNSEEMRKEADLLDKLEDSVMMPAYLSKAKEEVTEEKIKEMLQAETWLNAEEIQNTFNVTYIDEEKQAAASVDLSMLSKYKNVPENLKGSFFNAKKQAKLPEMDAKTKEMIDRVNKKCQQWGLLNK